MGRSVSKLYNRAFKVGVGFNIALFTIFNVVSYLNAHSAVKIQFSVAPAWGFSFSRTSGDSLAFMVNIVVIASCSFIVGFLFRYLAGRANGDGS